jgi:hypothetical protein
LRSKCIIKHVIERKVEGRIEVTGRLETRYNQLLGDLKGMRGYWKLEEEGLDRSRWRTCFEREYELAIRQTSESSAQPEFFLGEGGGLPLRLYIMYV